MSLDEVIKVEVTAHNSVMDRVLESLQGLSIIQIDKNRISEWESEKRIVEDASQQITDLRKELLDVEKALRFLQRYAPKIPILQKLRQQPDEVSRQELVAVFKKAKTKRAKEDALDIEKKISEIDTSVRELSQKRDGLVPFVELDLPLDLLHGEHTGCIVSRLDNEEYDRVTESADHDLLQVERISGDQTVFFYITYHTAAFEEAARLEKEFHFEPISLPDVPKSPNELIEDCTKKIEKLEKQKGELQKKASLLASETKPLKYYCDYLQTEIEKNTAKEKLFFT